LNGDTHFVQLSESIAVSRPIKRGSRRSTCLVEVPLICQSPVSRGNPLSQWSRSSTKRLFDCACIIPLIPLLIPAYLLIAMAVRLTSPGPVFFLQKRIGRYGRAFTILKFRTMIHSADIVHRLVTTESNQQFTPIGPLLRRWKLDELPQLLNVLWGDMSLVGPRPKVREHRISVLPCRPGITGAATIAFAGEETALARVSKHQLDSWYQDVVLPVKRRLDSDYMARATFFSDLQLIVKSVLRRWNNSAIQSLLFVEERSTQEELHRHSTSQTAGHGASREGAPWPQVPSIELNATVKRPAALAAD